MIEFNNLSFQYPQSEKPLFSGMSLQIPANSLTLVSGQSGSGKSTLLRLVNGLVPHFSGGTIKGQISICDKDPIREGPERMAEIVGFVFQEPEAQFVYDAVEDEIAFVLENFSIPYPDMRRRVNEILTTFGLDSLRKEKVQNLSGGEKQKVALASVMVNHPEVLLLDEPTSQLDPAAAEEILNFVLRLKAQYGLTILISEHRLERLLPFIDNICYIDYMHEVHFGSPQKILPEMLQVPPIIKISRKFNLSPLPLSTNDFPRDIDITQPGSDKKHEKTSIENITLIKLKKFSVKLSGSQVLSDIAVNIKTGEILSILGPNGAGKTTLLRGIMGLIKSEGQKQLFNKNMTVMNPSNLFETIAYLPQNPNDLLFSESVVGELKTTLKNHEIKKSEAELSAFLAHFGLEALKDRFPRDLSVGERQRTALAAITVHAPEVIFLDEPTRGMDYFAKETLAYLLKTWRDQHKAIVLVTHDVEFAATLSDRVVLLEAGRIRFDGAPKAAFTQFPQYQTQTAKIFPGTGWITPDEVLN